MVKGRAKKEPEPKINNFGSATLNYFISFISLLLCKGHFYFLKLNAGQDFNGLKYFIW